jgi:hypothetical protein
VWLGAERESCRRRGFLKVLDFRDHKLAWSVQTFESHNMSTGYPKRQVLVVATFLGMFSVNGNPSGD